MKKYLIFLIGLIAGVTFCLLVYTFGFDLIGRYFQQTIATYIIISVMILSLSLTIFFVIDKKVSKIEKDITIVQEIDFEQIIKNREWSSINTAVTNIQKKGLVILSRWGIMNWTFRVVSLIILGFVGLFGSVLLQNQNELLKKQNNRLDQQTYLQEAERRSSLVFLFSNIMDAINLEISSDYKQNGVRDLSPQLTGRIIALANRLKPYYYLQGDSLIKEQLSPERGQLLLTLVESKLSDSTFQIIKERANFSYSDLSQSNLSGLDLSYINLSNSNMEGVNLSKTKLIASNFANSNLRKANFTNVDIQESNFENANMENVNLRGSFGVSPIFTETNLTKANYQGVKFDIPFFKNPVLDSMIVDCNFFIDLINQEDQNEMDLGGNEIISKYSIDTIRSKNYKEYKPRCILIRKRIK